MKKEESVQRKRGSPAGNLNASFFTDTAKHKEIIDKANQQKIRRLPHEAYLKHFVNDLQQDIPLWAYVVFLYWFYLLLFLERAGKALVCCCALIFSDFNIKPWSVWSWWLAASIVLMAMYELWWVRYFRSERRLEDFYSSFAGIPLAGATLPAAAFFLLGIYGKIIWMPLAAAIMGIGYIGIHMQHSKRRDSVMEY